MAKARIEWRSAPIPGRIEPMERARIVPWLVEFSRTDAAALSGGRPGDLPNFVYELRQWLDLEPDEPLQREVSALEKDPARIQTLVGRVGELLAAVADRKRFEIRYAGGGVILDAARLGMEDGRALSYRDAKLEDAVLRVALDDLYEDVESALRVRRCPECLRVYYAGRQNQQYCGNKCSNARATRRYREGHRKERARKERERYKRARRPHVGSGTVIGRRGDRK
jgi:hypothetical protein